MKFKMKQGGSKQILQTAAGAVLVSLLAGCGGGTQDFGGLSRTLGGDIGTGYNGTLGGSRSANGQSANTLVRGTYPMIETSFQLASVPGDPFDYEKVNVQVAIKLPDATVLDVPAFFDGGTTWRMRFSPTAPGQYAVNSVKLNREIAHEEKLEKKEWNVNGNPAPGFIRIERGDHTKFVFDNGNHYFPLGHNVAWGSKELPTIPEMFAKMHDSGENWSRVWMSHWDGKNLDWSADDKPKKLGELDLTVAKKWDEIVQSAEKNNLYFQMTLQHHGQYSSKDGNRYSGNVNPNWEANPYNVKNGGFLQNPENFFINPQARALTKRKLYYILARWGYSPNIMAFELFNEVEGTDAAKGKQWDDIALWHREMALFLRQYDSYRHLLTTSSIPAVPQESPIWETVDYLQTHTYPSDVLVALGPQETIKGKKLDKPHFIGEFGPDGVEDKDGAGLHTGLWASLMRGDGGAAQYWSWDMVEKNKLYSHFKAASEFITASGLAGKSGMISKNLPVQTSQKGDLKFGPGAGWADAKENEFVVGNSGVPSGFERYPSFLQGNGHRAMNPKPLVFQVNFTQPGKFGVSLSQISKGGAHLKLSVDGKGVEQDYPAADANYAPKSADGVVMIDVPVGAHTISLENTGADWANIKQFSFSNYATALGAAARIGKDSAVAWIYQRASLDSGSKVAEPASGRILLDGLQPGKYRATWWDTREGRSLDVVDLTVSKDKESATLATPPILRDVALYVAKAGTPDKKGKGGKSKTKTTTSVYADASASGDTPDKKSVALSEDKKSLAITDDKKAVAPPALPATGNKSPF